MPNNSISWGQGAANNNIGWGAGVQNNNLNWGKIHAESYGHDETNLVGAGPSFFELFGTPTTAFSLRSLDGTNGEVIEARRDSDDAVSNFTPTQILDGSLVSWVGAGNNGLNRTWFNQNETTAKSYDFSAGTDGLASVGGSSAAPTTFEGVDDALKFTINSSSGTHFPYEFNVFTGTGGAVIEFDYYIPSSNAIVDGIQINDGSVDIGSVQNVTDAWTTAKVSGVRSGTSLYIYAVDGTTKSYVGNGTDVIYIKNVVAKNNDFAQQTTAIQQPFTVEAGALVENNNLPALNFGGTSIMNFPTSNKGTFSWFFVLKMNTASPTNLEGLVGDTASVNSRIRMLSSGNLEIAINGSGDQSSSISTQAQLLISIIRVGTTLNWYANGVSIGTETVSSADFVLNQIGGYANTILGDWTIQEFIAYDEDKTTELTAIEAEITEHYSIT